MVGKVCQCKNGSYSRKCCGTYSAQGIGVLEGQSNSVIDHKSTLKTIVSERNATEI